MTLRQSAGRGGHTWPSDSQLAMAGTHDPQTVSWPWWAHMTLRQSAGHGRGGHTWPSDSQLAVVGTHDPQTVSWPWWAHMTLAVVGTHDPQTVSWPWWAHMTLRQSAGRGGHTWPSDSQLAVVGTHDPQTVSWPWWAHMTLRQSAGRGGHTWPSAGPIDSQAKTVKLMFILGPFWDGNLARSRGVPSGSSGARCVVYISTFILNIQCVYCARVEHTTTLSAWGCLGGVYPYSALPPPPLPLPPTPTLTSPRVPLLWADAQDVYVEFTHGIKITSF